MQFYYVEMEKYCRFPKQICVRQGANRGAGCRPDKGGNAVLRKFGRKDMEISIRYLYYMVRCVMAVKR